MTGVAAVVTAVGLRIGFLSFPNRAEASRVLSERLPIFRIWLVSAAILMNLMVAIRLRVLVHMKIGHLNLSHSLLTWAGRAPAHYLVGIAIAALRDALDYVRGTLALRLPDRNELSRLGIATDIKGFSVVRHSDHLPSSKQNRCLESPERRWPSGRSGREWPHRDGRPRPRKLGRNRLHRYLRHLRAPLPRSRL